MCVFFFLIKILCPKMTVNTLFIVVILIDDHTAVKP